MKNDMMISSSPPGGCIDPLPLPTDCESGLLDLGGLSVGALIAPGPDADEVAKGIEEAGLIAIEVGTPDELLTQKGWLLSVVDVAAPGAEAAILGLSLSRQRGRLVALVRNPEEEMTSLRRGASVALRKPVRADLIAWHVARLKDQARQSYAERDAIERVSSEARADSVQRIAAVMSHELCGPLTAVVAGAGLLRAQLRDDRVCGRASWDDLEQLANEIENSANRVQRSVEEMRSLTRGGVRRSTCTELAEVVREAITETPNSRQVPIALQVVSNEHALAIPDLLRHVIDNLIANALHAVRSARSPQVTIRVYALNGESRISVRDNGAGVPPDLRDRIFEPFFTTKGEEGTGVGLALCRELMARMGGALTLAAGGRGACFRVRLRPA
ncbi:MAG: HAMP domain-containing histidine kinase [Deltaproteobacteria bacterium]|nr:HAMP domain-containing histidine kinase [Deltaproteobacteria bacterium]